MSERASTVPSDLWSSVQTAPTIIVRNSPIVPTGVYNSYWRFAAERQRIFFRRFLGASQPWTEDAVLATYKFTNAYRASDRVSQYLIRRVIYRPDLPSSEAETCFRILLFKLFNKIETWELLETAFGAITYADYTFERYDRVLATAMRAGSRIYSAAYIMPPGGGHAAKHQNHLCLLDSMMKDGLPKRLAEARTMRQGFDLLLGYPTIGNFLAYQFITDMSYSESDLIRRAADRQEAEFERLGLVFDTLWGRRLQLVDCQNLFCEISKYARVAHPEVEGSSGRTRIKQKYRSGGSELRYWYPPKWGINDKVGRTFKLLPDL